MKNNHPQTLIFLPGWSFSASMWQHIGGLMDNNKKLYIIKCIELSKISETKKFPMGSILIGWSLGGLMAIKHCLLYPNRYQKLILVNSIPYFSKFTADYKQLAENDLLYFQTLFLRWVFYPYHSRKVKLWHHYFLQSTRETQQSLLSQLNILFETNLHEEYKKITLPILHVHGFRDAIVPNEYQHIKSNESIQILSGGHALPFTHTGELSEIMRDFL